jgi:hypothetical protein
MKQEIMQHAKNTINGRKACGEMMDHLQVGRGAMRLSGMAQCTVLSVCVLWVGRGGSGGAAAAQDVFQS